MTERILPDHALVERATRMRLSGQWTIDELAAEFNVSRRTMYRALPPEVRRGEIRVFSEEARVRQGSTWRNWHKSMQARRLPRNGSVTLRNGEVIETGRNVRRWKLFLD